METLVEESKQCTRCLVLRPASQFGKVAAQRGGYPKTVCKPCHVVISREWSVRNPEKVAAHQRAYAQRDPERRRRQRYKSHLKKYNFTLEEYEEMFAQQGGHCAICPATPADDPAGRTSLCVDHNHQTGRVRALLCGNCNLGFGNFKEDPDLLMAAAAYAVLHKGDDDDRDGDD